MVTDLKEFNYDPPQMYYDKASGEIKYKVKEVKIEKEKKIVSDFSELAREKKALLDELNLDENMRPKEEIPNDDKYAEVAVAR